MNWLEIVGFVAAILTSTGFVPQVIKAYQTKSVDDLSWGMLLIFGLGVSMWFVYGIAMMDRPLIFANALTLFFIILLISMRIKYRNNILPK